MDASATSRERAGYVWCGSSNMQQRQKLIPGNPRWTLGPSGTASLTLAPAGWAGAAESFSPPASTALPCTFDGQDVDPEAPTHAHDRSASTTTKLGKMEELHPGHILLRVSRCVRLIYCCCCAASTLYKLWHLSLGVCCLCLAGLNEVNP